MRWLMAMPILAQVPNPRPEAPPGLGAFGNSLIAWMKWGGMVAGMVGLTVCGIMMAVGRRNRSQLAVDGAAGVPWVGAGMALIGAAATFVGFFLS